MTQTIKTYPMIYKPDSKGRMRRWYVEAIVADGLYRTIHGRVGAEPTSGGWNSKLLKGGLEATVKSLYDAKLTKGGYSRDAARAGMVRSPMLAEIYNGWDKDMEESGVWVQPKYDGIRCIADKDGLWTRTGRRITSCPHIEEALIPAFEVNPELVLDGELYNHEFRDKFNELSGLIRRSEPSEEIKAVVQYHVYDSIMEHMTFATRRRVSGEALRAVRALYRNLPERCIRLVEDNEIFTERDLMKRLERDLADGYEGTMVRRRWAEYEQKRSKALLKLKRFTDTEFPILDVLRGNGRWSDAAKTVVCSAPNGKTFEATLPGTLSENRVILQHGSDYVGGYATVKHQGYSARGIPRIPVVKHLYKEDEEKI